MFSLQKGKKKMPYHTRCRKKGHS